MYLKEKLKVLLNYYVTLFLFVIQSDVNLSIHCGALQRVMS